MLFRSALTEKLFLTGCFALLAGLCYGYYWLVKTESDYQTHTKANVLTVAYNSPLTTTVGLLERVGIKTVAVMDYPLVTMDTLKEDVIDTRVIFTVHRTGWIAFSGEVDLQEGDTLYRIDMTLPDFYNKHTKAFCIAPQHVGRHKQCFLAIPL